MRPLARLLLTALLACGVARAQSLQRLVDVVDANDAERNVDILVQLRCSAQYLSHGPADLGASVTIRMRLGADCGATGSSIGSELPPISGSSSIVRRARLEESGLGQISITLEWKKTVNFVLAPTSNGHGVRLRLLEALPGRGKVTAIDSVDPLSGYAINLESSTTPISTEALQTSAEFLHVPTYVSRIELEGTTFYRLRAGPIALRRDAERVLALAQQRYSRAWLGVNDEPAALGIEPGAVPSTVQPQLSVDAALPQSELDTLLDNARSALARRDYPKAIELLTKLTRQPEFPQRARAQEMLGLARERAGQLAHAKAEYSEYLRRYPNGEAAPRLRFRMRMLASAGRRGRNGTGGLDGFDDDGSWRLSGGASQMYRWERVSLTAAQVTSNQQTQNGLYTDGDFTARRRGERFDIISRISAGYAKDLLTGGPGDQTRISSAFVEINDRSRGIAGRFGRQSRNSGGLLGTFDGAYASWQFRPRTSLSAAFGLPVESTLDSPNGARRFLGVAADFGPFKERWDIGVFAVAQTYSGQTDRRALGIETRYFVPGRTVVGMLDYDLFYHSLNSAVLMGSLQLPARWTASFNLDHRRAPVLTTRNALIGQPASDLDQLLGLFSSSQIKALAEDRTPLSDIYTLSLSRPLGERLQFTADAFVTRVGETPSSGGVAATPKLPLEKSLQLQLIGSSLWKSNDLFVIAGRYQDGARQKTESLLLSSRLPIGSSWRIGPRLRVDHSSSTIDEATELLYVPGLRLDYQRGGTWIELEGGAEIGRRVIPAETENSQRYYFSLGYRMTF